MPDGSIAVLGATSQLARDFIAEAGARGRHRLDLYARRPEVAEAMLASGGGSTSFLVRPLDSFGSERHAAVLNFIGVGDPARAIAMGAEIFTATRRWDDRVLDYLRQAPETVYVFLSSGAVYGDAFDAPVTSESKALYPINSLGPQNWYALAKLAAEAVHRAETGRTIIDVRIFNYFSGSVDPETRFLVTDMLRCARKGEVFETSDQEIVRDYLEPKGLYALLCACLDAPRSTNMAVDAYSRKPIGKREMLELIAGEFGLEYRIAEHPGTVNATGVKPYYFSLNHSAGQLGYQPLFTSAEAIVSQGSRMLQS